MKIWNFLLLCSLIFSLSSCFNTNDELWISADGSGRFETTTDLSSVYPFLMMGLESELEKSKKEGQSGESGDEFKDMFMGMLKGAKIDTTFDVQNIMTSALSKDGMSVDDFWNEMENKLDEEEDMNDAQKEATITMMDQLFHSKLRMQADKENQVFKTTMIQSFESFENFSSLGKDLMEVLPYIDGKGDSPLGANELASMDQLFNSFTQMDIEDGTLRIRRSGLDLSSLGGEMKEVAPMLRMFLGNSPYRLTIHLPGKVKKVSEGVEKIDKKTVAIEMSLDDLFNPEKSIDYQIKFKGLKK